MAKVVKRQRASYSVEQKRVVVTYALQHGRNSAARHFELDAAMVGRWVKASKNWSNETNSDSKRVGSGRKAFYPEAEEELYTWVLEQRKKALAVTFVTIRLTMFEILKKPDMVALYGDQLDFIATFRWLTGFMKRYNLALRRRTRISQKLPEQTTELLANFHRFVIRIRIKNSIELCNIFNMDETPVWFDMAGNITINPKGEKTVHVRGTGNEKNRFTVVLTCAAGKKL
jgi:transposase-like protein